MNGMFIVSKLIPDAAAIWLQRWSAISGSLFLYLSGQKAQSGILNSIISDALASVAFKSGAVSGTASSLESDNVINTGEKEEGRSEGKYVREVNFGRKKSRGQ